MTALLFGLPAFACLAVLLCQRAGTCLGEAASRLNGRRCVAGRKAGEWRR